MDAQRTDWRGRVYPVGTVLPVRLRQPVDDPCDDWSGLPHKPIKDPQDTVRKGLIAARRGIEKQPLATRKFLAGRFKPQGL